MPAQDTPKDEIMSFLKDNILNDAKDVEDSYAYMFGSVGFIRFTNKGSMMDFLRKMKHFALLTFMDMHLDGAGGHDEL